MTSGLLSAPGHDSPEPGYGQDQEVLPLRPAVSPRQAHPARLAASHGMMAQWHLAPGSFSWDAVADTLTPE